jgi:hypothetical protein
MGMLANNKIRIIGATEKNVFFARSRNLSSGGSPGSAELPLAEFLSGEFDSRLISGFQEKRSRILLVVPDHWIKHDFFLFRSQKETLIRPFIERKLKAAYPNLTSVQCFFNYSCRQKNVEGPGVRVFHLSEPRAFDLYAALSRSNLTPRWIATPALLWEERLNRQVPEFAGQAALVIHLQWHESFLYFYHNGDFLFSREVALPESSERWDALLFEINQSIYLFSQKAKSDLQSVYLIGDEAGFQERLTDLLGRPVRTVSTAGADPVLPKELAALDGLLEPDGTSAPADAHCITHTRIQQQVKWRPVQWAAMLIAAILLAFFGAEHQWLEERLSVEMAARSRMRQQQPMSLADYDAVVVELTDDLSRPSPPHTIFTIVSSLPEGVLINELRMDADTLRVDLAATVHADSIDRFRQLLKNLVENFNRRLNLTPPITMEDVVFTMEEAKHQAIRTDYKIACKIQLP